MMCKAQRYRYVSNVLVLVSKWMGALSGYLLNFKNNLDIEFTLRPTPEAALVWVNDEEF
jgi:hypothetical protein